MTYLEYLLLFIILPIGYISYLIFKKKKSYEIRLPYLPFFLAFGVLSFIAVVYTTPWDNYLVAHRIWYYDPSKILGIIIGFVPLEEYLFFILETLFVCLITFYLILNNGINMPENISRSYTKSKIFILFFIAILWFLNLITFIMHMERLLYLNLLLLWAIPPIFFQLLLGWDILLTNKTLIGKITLLLGSYLSITDAFAIANGIWTINPNFTMGIIFVVIPLEEILFFFVTVVLILFGFILIIFFSNKYMLKSSQPFFINPSKINCLSGFIIKG